MAFNDAFTGTAGQKIIARSGWAMLGSGSTGDNPEINAAGTRMASAASNGDAGMIGQDTGTTDHYVQAKLYTGFQWGESGNLPLLCVRTDSRNEGWGLMYRTSTSSWQIYKAGAGAGLRGSYAATFVDGDVVRLEAEGADIRFYLNGTLRLTDPGVTDGLTQTGVGILVRNVASSVDIADDWESGALAPADTTAPTLTSAALDAISPTALNGSVTTDEAGPAWAVITTSATTPTDTQIKAGEDHTGSAAVDSDTATLSIGANADVFSFTGSASTTYYMHVVQDDEAGSPNTSDPISSAGETTPTPDAIAPLVTSVGALVKSNALAVISATTNEANGTMYLVTTTSATPPDADQVMAGTDHADAAAVFDDLQAIGSTGVKTFNATGHTALQTYYGYVMHRDAAGNNSDVEATGSFVMFDDGATGQAIIDDTSAIPGVQEDGILVNDVELPADADKWFTYDVVTPVVDTASLTLFPNGSLIWTGTSADSFTYQLKVDGVDVGAPQLVTLAPVGPPDDEDPVLTGDLVATDITDTSYTLTWPAATDNAGVAGYEVSLNNGSSYTNVGLVLTTGITGRTPEATDLTRVRAYDAAGNRSDFLAESVTLLETPEPPDEIAPELSLPTATTTGATTADATVTTNEADGALFWVRTANLTEDKNAVVATATAAGATQAVTASGLQSYGVTGLDPASTGRVHTVHRDAAGNVSDTISTAEFTTNAFGGGAGGNSTGLSIGLRIGL